MSIRILLTVIVLLLFLPSAAFAHTSLQSSIPADEEVVTEPLNEIVLDFNTVIEKLSTFTLSNEQEQKINIEVVREKQDKLVGKLSDPLPSGSYRVDYTIVGEDGHPIERNMKFTVNLPEPTTMPESSSSPQSTTPADSTETIELTTSIDPLPSEESVASEIPLPESDDEPSAQQENNEIMIAAVAGVVVLGVLITGVLWIRRKK